MTSTDTAKTYTRARVTAALGTARRMIDAITDAMFLEDLAVGTWAHLGEPGSFTREQVTGALNAAADEVAEAEGCEDGETSETIWTQDVLNLAVNVAGYLLDHPQAELADTIAASWADLDDLSYTVLNALPEGEPEPARGTPERDAAIVTTVLEWIS